MPLLLRFWLFNKKGLPGFLYPEGLLVFYVSGPSRVHSPLHAASHQRRYASSYCCRIISRCASSVSLLTGLLAAFECVFQSGPSKNSYKIDEYIINIGKDGFCQEYFLIFFDTAKKLTPKELCPLILTFLTSHL